MKAQSAQTGRSRHLLPFRRRALIVLLAACCAACDAERKIADTSTDNTANAPAAVSARLAASPATDQSEAWVGFRPEHITLGELPWNSSQPFTLTLVNASGADITISDVRTSCNCAVVSRDELLGRVVPRGGSVEVSGSFEAGDRGGVSRQSVTLFSSEGFTASATVEAIVTETYHVYPRVVDFGEVEIGTAATADAKTIVFQADEAIIADAGRVDAGWLRVVQEPITPSETALHFVVVPEQLPYGKNVARATFATTDAFKPEFSVFVTAIGVGRLRAAPSQLFLTRGESAIARFITQDGAPAVVESVQQVGEGYRVRPTPSRDGVEVLRLAGARGATVWVTDNQGARARVILVPANE